MIKHAKHTPRPVKKEVKKHRNNIEISKQSTMPLLPELWTFLALEVESPALNEQLLFQTMCGTNQQTSLPKTDQVCALDNPFGFRGSVRRNLVYLKEKSHENTAETKQRKDI